MTTPNPMANQPAGYDGDAGDWLMGGSVKSFSFKGQPPITATGVVCEPPSKMQKRDFKTGEPVFWGDGQPRIMMKIVLQTTDRDPQNPDDDGKRAIYLEGRKAFAVRDACKAVGANRGPEVGGTLSLTYTHDDVAAKKGNNEAPKDFKATYQPGNPLDQVVAPQQGGWGAIQGPPAAVSHAQPFNQPAAASAVDAVAFLASKGISIPDPVQAAAVASQFPDFPK